MAVLQGEEPAMKDPLRVAAVQFEMAENDKPANLRTIVRFVEQAAAAEVDVICFPEACLTGYHFWTQATREQLLEIGERVEGGPVTDHMIELARRHGMHILWGMLEREPGSDALYNTAAVVGPGGFIFKHRKVHAFENSAICQGDRIDTFELLGWRCAILICYDNNIPENARVAALKGAEIIFAPHQTGGFDIPRAGMGRIPLELWHNRHRDPAAIRQEILGPKGLAWKMKWLPCRAYDQNVYLVFSNGVGIDGPEVRTGCSMIIGPEGMVIAQTTEPADAMVIADLYRGNREHTLAGSHVLARRPSLYQKIVEPAAELDTRSIRNRVSGEKIR
jgi:N-carbamoylputrescine amidase